MTTDESEPRKLDADGYAIIGACFEVYNELGNGFLEDVYQECLERELQLRRIPFVAQHSIPISYKGHCLAKPYRADLLVNGRILVELKAARALLPEHEAQLLHYLKATGLRTGYLVNFGAAPRLDWRRRVR
ncbi:MAG: hypothetical protein B9S34_16200 [Opitutia bacterium Tous-C1TDCM]|nr:MAG: hypothetical protein B9S34_16200 [Opitutae bacterium Tous-C1TDCM]